MHMVMYYEYDPLYVSYGHIILGFFWKWHRCWENHMTYPAQAGVTDSYFRSHVGVYDVD